MAFNHYARLARILANQPEGWVIHRINQATSAKNFKGETVHYSHYYRIYGSDNQPIKYAKFQQIDRLARALNTPIENLPIIEQVNDEL